MTEPDPLATREQLERLILGHSPAHTSDQVAASAGVGLAEARRLWRALGFPDVGDAAAFNDADQDALQRIGRAVTGGVLDFETAVRLTRAVGQTMARLADWQVATLTGRVEDIEAGPEATGSRLGRAMEMVEETGPMFEQLLVYAWRRHLAASVARVEALGAADEDLHSAPLTIGFADLVAFTSLSNGLDESSLGDLVEGFESKAADLIASVGGRVIKALGDSVLFVSESATAGVDTALQIVDVIAADASLPDVRVGMASGPVITRMGDVFGPPVNMAARLTTVARRNRVIIDHDTAARLPRDRFAVQSLPPRPLRGFGSVEPLAVRRTR
ncbi:MAG TPA: adenylate/guanylate cyclase domain-containing protein [Nocardioidaceae bacterium]|nr:adenylate/guanylate cyclase domain-containing protein [Nocardioidaceae bacterium]